MDKPTFIDRSRLKMNKCSFLTTAHDLDRSGFNAVFMHRADEKASPAAQ
jgi:hypothetical protein